MTKKLLLILTIVSFNFAISQNNYLDFDGTNDNIEVTNSGNIVANATAITLSCKVYPKTTSSGFPLFDGFAGYRNETNFDFYIVQLSTSQVEARFRNSSGAAFTIAYNGLVLNQWNHFFLVYNGAALKLYSGTTEVGSIAASGSVPATNTFNLQIGLIKFQSYNWYHNGYIDEVSLWNKELLPTEISTIISNNGEIANPAAETNLKLYYKFNQGIPYGNNTGLTTLTDEKATANGTLFNFALTGNFSNWGSQILNNTAFTTYKNYAFPNPTSSILNFSGILNISTIKIIDFSGRIVQVNQFNSTQDSSIDVSLLKSGLYIAIINNDITIKFIKK